jgi:hypothetical protein
MQLRDHGDAKYLNRLIRAVVSWPYIEEPRPYGGFRDSISLRLSEKAATENAAAFITCREFARILFGARTVYLALPLVDATWAIVRGWAEGHYLASEGLIPAGVVVLYTPRDEEELVVSYSLFWIAYTFACATHLTEPNRS